MKKFYITTPIYYPNAKPHLGSAYTTIVADTLKRFYSLMGYKTFFLTGTDEHGEKLQDAAEKAGKTPKEFVDEIVKTYKAYWKALNIEYDRFIRTTDKDHEEVVKSILQKVYENGDIYFGVYEGYYCKKCERYYTKKDLIDGEKCPYHYEKVELKRIDTYFFKLSKYKDKLLKFYASHPNFLPKNIASNIIERVNDLQDLAISRPKSQLTWGIEIPFDKNHVVYVWFDALLNYLSGIGYGKGSEWRDVWPPDAQIMGKDIAWFHCVIWPAMLMSAGIDELPKREIIHGFITVDGKKMSKSLGNVVDPLDVVEKYGADALRYYLIQKMSLGSDGDFTWEGLKEAYKKEMIGNIGNTINRIIVLSHKILSKEDFNEELSIDEDIKRPIMNVYESLNENMESLNVEEIMNKNSKEIVGIFTILNKYLNEKEPWKTKDKHVMRNLLEGLYIALMLSYPLLPGGMSKALSVIKGENWSIEDINTYGANIRQLPNEKRLIIYENK